jgi:methylthioribose-1-phosphate isomerase
MEAIRWDGHTLHLLDQRRLPMETHWVTLSDWKGVAIAIEQMIVRGAPAIAIAASYGFAMAVSAGEIRAVVTQGLLNARPTAVNLKWALERMATISNEDVAAEAVRIHAEDRSICQAIGTHGASLLSGGILTICNTGSLATGGYGTALGMIRTAHAQSKDLHVYVMETRPYLQGARLTAYECEQDNIPFTLITDGMAGALMATGRIQAVVVGCDRVAINGDTANKIGTYGLACLAHHHRIPLWVAMPTSTLDRDCDSGEAIPIEERPQTEVTHVLGTPIAPLHTHAWNPAFDVTPAHLIDGWVTEYGVWKLPFPNELDAPIRKR